MCMTTDHHIHFGIEAIHNVHDCTGDANTTVEGSSLCPTFVDQYNDGLNLLPF